MMNAAKQMGTGRGLLLWVLLITGMVGTEAWAQGTFYGVYGDHQNFDERGFNRVIPVTQCVTSYLCPPGPQPVQVDGYIAVGYSTMPSQGAYSDVYVVRTFNDGTTAWERTFDIGNNQMNDRGYAIVELAPNPDNACFAIVGTSEQMDMVGILTTDIFVLLIDQDGNVIRSSTFDAGGDEEGRDIIQAQFQYNPQPPPVAPYPGNPAPVPSRPGDLVFCGWTTNGQGGTTDGVIIRTDLNLVRAWDGRYDLPHPMPPIVNAEEHFLALTESLNHPAAARNGDILVAGRHFSPSPFNPNAQQGLVGRVQGFDGMPAGPGTGTGFGEFGGTGDEEFNSIIELVAPGGMGGTAGDVVAVGRTNSPSGGGAFNIYMIDLFAGDPCPAAGAFIDLYFGDPGLDMNNHVGTCVREVQVGGLSFAGVGDLLVTGFTDLNISDDVLLAAVRMPLFAPNPSGFLYGDFGSNTDRGMSLADVPAVNGRPRGVIMCGWTNSALCNVPANTEDLFLVKTNSMGSATNPCTQIWDIQYMRSLFNGCLNYIILRQFNDMRRMTSDNCWDTHVVCCASPAPDDTFEKPGRGSAPEADEDLSGSMIRTRPNPVKGGDVLNLAVTPSEPTTIMVTVTNMRGEEIFRRELPEVGEGTNVPISTDGWPSGAYLLKATDGKRIDAVRVNVLE